MNTSGQEQFQPNESIGVVAGDEVSLPAHVRSSEKGVTVSDHIFEMMTLAVRRPYALGDDATLRANAPNSLNNEASDPETG